jgi:hypothetical protein
MAERGRDVRSPSLPGATIRPPGTAIRPQADTVDGQADQRPGDTPFGADRGDMRLVMRHALRRNAIFQPGSMPDGWTENQDAGHGQ